MPGSPDRVLRRALARVVAAAGEMASRTLAPGFGAPRNSRRATRAASTAPCVRRHDGYGLIPVPAISQSDPSPAVSASARGSWLWPCSSPSSPSIASAAPRTPDAANVAASTASCAASPACSRLFSAPLTRYCMDPAAIDPANPNASSIRPPSSPSSLPAAAVPPNSPAIAVGWNPRWYAPCPRAAPTRQQTSYPRANAASSLAPQASTRSATARAAGMTAAPGCSPLAMRVSSKSRLGANVSLSSAA